MKSIKDIYNSLQQEETVLFQVKSRKILNLMLREFEKIDDYIFWDKYKEIPLNEIYLCVGCWRLGMAGIFNATFEWYGEYCFDSFLIDWKASDVDQEENEKKVNKFIEIMDKYRRYIKISKKKYEEFK